MCYHFIDPLHKHSEQEDSGDRWSQVAWDWLDVIEKLATLSSLDDWDPTDTDGYDAKHPESEEQ